MHGFVTSCDVAGETVEHKEHHHEHHRKEHEQSHPAREGKFSWPIHPKWVAVLGFVLTVLVLLMWTFLT